LISAFEAASYVMKLENSSPRFWVFKRFDRRVQILLNIDIENSEPDFRQNEYRLTFLLSLPSQMLLQKQILPQPNRNTINDGIFLSVRSNLRS
jgi:hypothetical protein